jgi:alkanesulfonate monooxygenase SsuD/methylene tetrahydromethanopterin reductase-like flavin-dependent oxidoreductase (luciferase family)
VFIMRFDMRAPSFGAPPTELYDAAIEMAAWGETNGCAAVMLCEHHASSDGYLPSPMMLAAAIAARTTTIPIQIAAAILPLYDPIRLAEDMNVLDIVSKGRISYILAMGYRPEDFEQYGVDFSQRGPICDEKLGLLRTALEGAPGELDGRRIHVTPPPATPGGPRLAWGGGTVAAAKRAGRYGLAMSPQGSKPGMLEAYEAAAREHGHEPEPLRFSDPDNATTVFVADDLDRAWSEIGPHLLHDASIYAEWNPRETSLSQMSYSTTVAELRAERSAHRILTVDEAVAVVQGNQILMLHPLCGGLPPAIAWRYLRLVAEEVLPRAREARVEAS